MCLDRFDVIEIWLPVFDNAVVAGGNEPVLVMRVSGRSYCYIVCLVHLDEKVLGRKL